MIRIFVLVFTCIVVQLSTHAQNDYIASIEEERKAKDLDFRYNTESPLKEEDREVFTGLHYFKIDSIYKTLAAFKILSEPESILMQTSGTRTPEYLRYAIVSFELGEELHQLTVYKSVKYQDDPKLKDYIFIPFRDLNSGESTYGGGRYLDQKLPEGDSLILDFNKAYNPYCAYNEKYSCVIPPPENSLNIHINAGEKVFDDH